MRISIIVPVYNTERYLSECLDSLLAQSWQEMEIICVDDGSSDGSAGILADYARRDGRVRVIHQENRGLSGARNSGLRAASGDYVCFVDSDDALKPNACERLAMECLGKEPDLIVFSADTMPESKRAEDTWLEQTLSAPDWMCRDGNLYEVLRQPSAWPFVWRNCIRRGILEEQKLEFDESVRYGEDTLFQLCLLPACRRISMISDRLYRYRIGREGSLMSRLQEGTKVRAELHVPLVERVARYWADQGWMKRWGDIFYAWSLEFAAHDVNSAPTEQRKEYAGRLIAVWEENGLRSVPCTMRCRVYEKMVYRLAGAGAVSYYAMRLCQKGFMLAHRIAARLLN